MPNTDEAPGSEPDRTKESERLEPPGEDHPLKQAPDKVEPLEPPIDKPDQRPNPNAPPAPNRSD